MNMNFRRRLREKLASAIATATLAGDNQGAERVADAMVKAVAGSWEALVLSTETDPEACIDRMVESIRLPYPGNPHPEVHSDQDVADWMDDGRQGAFRND